MPHIQGGGLDDCPNSGHRDPTSKTKLPRSYFGYKVTKIILRKKKKNYFRTENREKLRESLEIETPVKADFDNDNDDNDDLEMIKIMMKLTMI